QLVQKANDLLAFLTSPEEAPDLASLAYTLQVGREAMLQRWGAAVESMEGLVEQRGEFIKHSTVKQEQSLPRRDRIGDGTDAYINELIINRDFTSLLVAWISGADIDWKQLYAGSSSRAKRISLPTYPFAKERYWIEPADYVDSMKRGKITAALHPFVHK